MGIEYVHEKCLDSGLESIKCEPLCYVSMMDDLGNKQYLSQLAMKQHYESSNLPTSDTCKVSVWQENHWGMWLDDLES